MGRSACRFVEPTRTYVPSSSPSWTRKWGLSPLGWTCTTTRVCERHGRTSISGTRRGEAIGDQACEALFKTQWIRYAQHVARLVRHSDQENATRRVRERNESLYDPFRRRDVSLELQRLSLRGPKQLVDIHSSAFYYEAAKPSKLQSSRAPREARSNHQPSAAQGARTTDASSDYFSATRTSVPWKQGRANRTKTRRPSLPFRAGWEYWTGFELARCHSQPARRSKDRSECWFEFR